MICKSKEFMEGRDKGLNDGMFENTNPYNPFTDEFEEWEEGFREGCKSQEWL